MQLIEKWFSCFVIKQKLPLWENQHKHTELVEFELEEIYVSCSLLLNPVSSTTSLRVSSTLEIPQESSFLPAWVPKGARIQEEILV